VVPDPRSDPDGFFAAIDVDASGTLDPPEVCDGLKATVELDHRRVETDIESLWPRWDTNNDQSICLQEFKMGLLPYILQHYPGATPSAPPATDGATGIAPPLSVFSAGPASPAQVIDIVEARLNGAIPDISSRPRDWFAYWDADDGGSLCKAEVLRAVVKTFNIPRASPTAAGGSQQHCGHIHVTDVLHNIWAIFDHDNNGEIDIDEFTSQDGLCDTLGATIMYVFV